MLYRKATSALGSSERQILRLRWMQSGQCARCFHASTRQCAGESSNGNPSAAAPKRRPSRQERSTLISNEVSMLQKSPPRGSDPANPPGSSTGTSRPSVPTTSRGFMGTSESMGGERMGENVSVGREGPNAQGVGQILPPEEEEGQQDSRRTNIQSISELAAAPGEDMTPISSKQESILRSRLAEIKPLGVPFRPSVPTSATDFIRSGYGASTPAANNFPGIITDRFAALTGTLGRRTPRTAEERAQRRAQGILTQLTAEDIQDLKDSGKRWRKHTIKDSIKKQVVAKLVQGRYGSQGLTGNSGNGTVLAEVRKKLMKNETFLKSDVEKVVGRVQAFMTKQAWAKVKPENGLRQGEI
ncbi:unnamed protein product [Zymoseptoria tritici ST99CH_1A5]|uniref:Uncharacterized protein n=2 Tax=Zymoseptoria tritici TaxID=1047171 RepID=A0A2H1GHP5_ZYMTR|nr:unnamed protein product [Zymoseptoria tritici ST99CH_1E4]SMR54665.1 unnamed protein product [Zymoseptoria tritici ST99CH_3D1]SMY24816.1 unnamed protein product [Zymoseptoria tritici ST99CH_1A5]